MGTRGTPSVPGWWVKFLAHELEHLPRPERISQEQAKWWLSNGAELGKVLDIALVGDDVLSVVNGTHRIVEIPRLTLLCTFTPTDTKPTLELHHDVFYNDFGKIFKGVGKGELSGELALHSLDRESLDPSIISSLGGREVARVSLADARATLAKKEKDEDYIELLCYVEARDGSLCTVRYQWCDTWVSETFPGAEHNPPYIDESEGWSPGIQILSLAPSVWGM